MKKYIIPIICLFIITLGILIFKNNKNESINNIETFITDLDSEPEIEENNKYIDTNPIKLGLYKNYRNNNPRKLIDTYEEKWQYHKDISSFEVYYTNDEEIDNTNQIKLFDKYLNNYSDISNYRIGYQIEFSINNQTIKKTILSPKDTNDFYDYLEIYLYDDYHRTGGWYSHTTEKEYNDNTLLTSIKLTAGKNINEITSDIILTTFTYDEDDFDEQGYYKGISKYTIIIKKSV